MIRRYSHTLGAFMRARYLAMTLRSRAAIARHHDRRVYSLLKLDKAAPSVHKGLHSPQVMVDALRALHR